MAQGEQENKNNFNQEISLRDILIKVTAGIKYLKSKWLILLTVGLVGGLVGFVYATLKKPTYTAVCTFVLEDAKSAATGQYSGLATLAGINIGDGGGGIFSGENIIELYKSRIMIEKALLSICSFDKKKQLLIDRFIDRSGLRAQLQNDNNVRLVKFNGDPDNFNRKQDSVVTALVQLFNEKILTVFKPDKKLNIIRVEVTSKDELFSKFFTEKLVETVNDFYVQTKTKKASQNVQILQHQADSVRAILNSSIHGVASAIDADPNANPLMATLRETSQKRQIDVQANTSIYSEMVKNLELAKIALRQEMPLIQVIDKPVLPLHVNRFSKLKGLVVGFILGIFISAGGIIVQKLIKKVSL